MIHYRYLSIAGALLCLSALPVSAEIAVTDLDARAAAAASPAIASNPAARAAAEANGDASASEKFVSTSASLHAEDQCRLADLSVSRFTPAVGQVTTFVNYFVRNLCDASGNGSGSLEVPDETFIGDPRTDNTVRLTLDLTNISDQVQGAPITVDLTWAKTPRQISRSNNRGSTRTQDLVTGVVSKTVFRSKNVNTTAGVTGESNLFPAESTGTIFWDDYETIQRIAEPADRPGG